MIICTLIVGMIVGCVITSITLGYGAIKCINKHTTSVAKLEAALEDIVVIADPQTSKIALKVLEKSFFGE